MPEGLFVLLLFTDSLSISSRRWISFPLLMLLRLSPPSVLSLARCMFVCMYWCMLACLCVFVSVYVCMCPMYPAGGFGCWQIYERTLVEDSSIYSVWEDLMGIFFSHTYVHTHIVFFTCVFIHFYPRRKTQWSEDQTCIHTLTDIWDCACYAVLTLCL